MKKFMFLKLVSILVVFILMLVVCLDLSKEILKVNNKDNGSDKLKMVEIIDVYGIVKVFVNLKNVVVLDNRMFEILFDWGIKLVVVLKDIMFVDLVYKKDEKV